MAIQMRLAAVVLCSVLVALAVIQLGVMAVLVASWRRGIRRPAAGYAPKAAVILCLRGSDPFLEATLRALARQEYPDYTVFIVVDSAADPAASVVERFVAAAPPGRFVVGVLRDPLPTCSLKCSALIQALGALDPSYAVAAFIDADAMPYPTWLRDMVAPLADANVGATTGTRWYAPTSKELGTLVRYVWNVGAAAQTWLNDWAWGGSMAVHTRTVRGACLPEALAGALSDDITVERQMRRHHLKVRFVPQAIMVNRECVSLPDFFRWLERQMIIAKLGGHGWGLVVLQAALLLFSQPAALVLVLAAAAAGAREQAALCATGWLAYWASTCACVLAHERVVREILRRTRGESLPPNRALGWRLLPALALVHVVHPLALMRAALRRSIPWRGVSYAIGKDGEIRLQGYRPYMPSAGDANQSTSVI